MLFVEKTPLKLSCGMSIHNYYDGYSFSYIDIICSIFHKFFVSLSCHTTYRSAAGRSGAVLAFAGTVTGQIRQLQQPVRQADRIQPSTSIRALKMVTFRSLAVRRLRSSLSYSSRYHTLSGRLLVLHNYSSDPVLKTSKYGTAGCPHMSWNDWN